MKNEDSIVNDKRNDTVINNEIASETPQEVNRSVNTTSSGGKIIATGLGGILLGSVASYAAMHTSTDNEIAEDTTDTEDVIVEEIIDTPEWSNGQVSIATGVTDSMSFGEAFATARAEVGPGGAFEWKGNVYGTYLAEEWDNMTAQEKADYNEKFNWGAIDTSNNEQTVQEIEEYTEPVVVENTHNDNYTTEWNDVENTSNEDYTTETVEPVHDEEVEIEVLGIITDEETGCNMAPAIIDGNTIVYIDVDNDQVFDYAVQDVDNNMVWDENEILDIHDLNITTQDVVQYMMEEDCIDESVDYDTSLDDAIDYSDEIDI